MAEYFSHDYGARNDIKLKLLFMRHGVEGLGIYWCIVEMLYENGGHLPQAMLPIIAYDLRIDENTINSVIDDFSLFQRTEDGFFQSESITRRLSMRSEKSVKAKAAAEKRWNNTTSMRTQCERNATAMRLHSERMTKEKEKDKVKEEEIKKENKKKETAATDVAVSEFFERMWSLYPLKKGKSAVSKKAKEELYKAGEETITKAINNYKDSKEEWRHWLDGSTFFNGRWKDYIEPVEKTAEPAKKSEKSTPQNYSERSYDKSFFDEFLRGST